MRLFIAREALDPHLKVSGAALNSQLPLWQRIRAALKAAKFYAGWYPKQWLPLGASVPPGTHRRLARHLRYAARATRRLARSLFHAMARFGPKLEKQQVLLGRFVDIGAELFALAASCSRAQSLLARGTPEENQELLNLVDYFCASARLRIERNFAGVGRNTDSQGYRLAQQVLKKDAKVLEDGIVR